MKSNSLAKNIAYNMLNQIVALIVPLLTAPYISRVFNAELIGNYSYALANSSYFVLFECLGFSLYGQLKVAAYRDDEEETSKIFYEIMLLKVMLMSISVIAYIVLILHTNDLTQRKLCVIMLINIIANGIDVTWYLNGKEEFRLTALRSICVRVANVLLVLLFVESQNDIFLYAMIMQGATLVSYIAIYPTVLKQILQVNIRRLNIVRHIKPAGVYFVPGLVTTIFSSTDKTMLGVMSNTYEVGVYEQAHKISQICMNAISAIGNVLLPRASYLYHNDKASQNKANDLFYFSYKIVMLVSAPVTFGMAAIAYEFVPFFFGKGYDKSAVLLVILSVNVMITALSNLCGQQCLIARQRQKEYNVVILFSAVLNVILNYFCIGIAKSLGAAYASVIASASILVLIVYMSKREIQLNVLFTNSWKYLLSAAVMYVVVRMCTIGGNGSVLELLAYIGVGGATYAVLLFVLREQVMMSFWTKVCKMSKMKKEEKT